ncbi:hypothetical protein INS49_014431 [Diaporthe citri]|uniref:uncharacterized protein n=1 Tax=Diaporthe citri TaxID=83186 RepID=UPI001C81ABA2|nr:uncharacterized protein INS49_014431 [Diaporthe citri]KAG6356558.1 hypothetical protein INS49_014431 [Diaporthe citri]
MDLPPSPPQRIVRVAARLADLPVELVEPVLKDLSLHRVLQLATTPSATPSESRLRGIIEKSLSWRTVFYTGNDQPQRIWRSLSQLAWAWNRQNVQQVAFLNHSRLSLSPGELVRACGSEFGLSVVRDLEKTFMQGFAQLLRIPGQHPGLHDGRALGLTTALLDGICRSIPVDVLTSIDAHNLGELPDASLLQDGSSGKHTYTSSTLHALQLFTMGKSSPFPSYLLHDARRAVECLWYVYGHDGKMGDEVRCARDRKTMQVRHATHNKDRRADASPVAELDRLESFLKCVRWAYAPYRRNAPKLLLEPADYRRYIEAEDPKVIGKQLLADFGISKNDSCIRTVFPSLTALYMPSYSSTRTREVASYIWPEMVDEELRKIYWEDAVHKLKLHLAKAPQVAEHEDGNVLACDASLGQDGLDEATEKYVAATALNKPKTGVQKTCYICRLRIHKPHKIFSAMCEPCGEFNLAGSSASLPHNLRLEGRTALVTGARVNLGFHVVLRLLHCGASVIASTRYPRDAVARYQEQPDSADWMGRLRVVGANFRTANDAFALVGQTRSILKEWGRGLDILINNAAQTLTDSVETEEAAVTRETALKGRVMPMLAEGSYEARVWRGASPNNVLKDAVREENIQAKAKSPTGAFPAKEATSETFGLEDLTLGQKSGGEEGVGTGEIIKRPEPSSWVQALSDIPYEDVITAHSINTFVPLILIRELLPIIGHRKHDDPEQPNTGHVVNVSSREGIFEASPKHGAKKGKHVHTNMSKAGLNMITETEASTAWQKYRVCMNTVDPGYMSAAPEYEKAYGGERPLGWEDGAGRVLWPIAMGEGSNGGEREKNRMGPIWGRFLKHYGAVRVDTRLGRG